MSTSSAIAEEQRNNRNILRGTGKLPKRWRNFSRHHRPKSCYPSPHFNTEFHSLAPDFSKNDLYIFILSSNLHPSHPSGQPSLSMKTSDKIQITKLFFTQFSTFLQQKKCFKSKVILQTRFGWHKNRTKTPLRLWSVFQQDRKTERHE